MRSERERIVLALNPPTRRSPCGLTLIECIAALAVISIALSGVARITIQARDLHNQSREMMIAAEVLESLAAEWAESPEGVPANGGGIVISGSLETEGSDLPRSWSWRVEQMSGEFLLEEIEQVRVVIFETDDPEVEILSCEMLRSASEPGKGTSPDSVEDRDSP